MAELGLNAIDTREALFSIAYIILARAKSKQQNEFGYHFTDLTSHQKYFGKLISDQISLEEEDWEIDYRKWKGEFFFHSRSGGMTFSQSVFSERKDISPGVKDILYSTNLPIDNPDDWTARIETKEMMQILHFQGNSQELLQLFQANRKEKIRLQINRVKGWNFLKSNYYSVSLKKNSLLFTGKGLGHNVGLNMNGAIVLSKMGFNRFEILEHYFPQISFVSKSNSNLPTNLSYALLSNQGDLLYTSYPYFLEKSIPPGSLMKLIVSFIFLKDKGFEMTRFNCVPPSSTICWKKEGHGELNLEGAIANSCNSYFAFLANAMPYMIFKTELNQWISRLPMENFLPNKISQKGYQRIMSGLDFNMKWKIKDIMQLLRYLMKSSPSDESREKMKIYLHETFQIGTASKFPFLLAQEKNPKSLWGKTSTIVYGSNEPLSYGIFMGGDDRYGIILLYRKGNGNKAAYYAKKILESK